MIRPHHVSIRKARGLQALGLRITGQGLWTVRCRTCPAEFPTCRRHDQAMDLAAAHLAYVAGPGLLSTDLRLDQDTADRIRAAVMAHAAAQTCGNPTGRRPSSRPTSEREPGSGACGNPTT